jgi:two-component system sensor histidine kinase FlrB
MLPEGDRVKFAEKSLGRLRHLERLIQGMLQFVKGQAGTPELVEVASLLADLHGVMEPQMQGREVRFTVGNDAGHARVRGDRKALTGALINLLENALQATPAGGRVTLKASRTPERVDISVSDTGTGMDRETCERVFEPFFTTRADGTGLGLAIVRGVAESHGGEVTVVSEPGKGTEFSISLPLEQNG